MLNVASEIFDDLLNKQKTHLEACHAIDSVERLGPSYFLSTEVFSSFTFSFSRFCPFEHLCIS